MSIQLEPREMYILPQEICKESTTKEIEVPDETIPKLKIRKWIKWLPKCSNSFIPSPISKREGLNFQKMGKGATNFGVIFSFLAIIVTDTAFAF